MGPNLKAPQKHDFYRFSRSKNTKKLVSEVFIVGLSHVVRRVLYAVFFKWNSLTRLHELLSRKKISVLAKSSGLVILGNH